MQMSIPFYNKKSTEEHKKILNTQITIKVWSLT